MLDGELQEDGLIARAVQTRAPVAVHDLLSAENFALRDAALPKGYRAAMSFPLVSNETVVAVFILYAAEPGFFDVGESRLLADRAGDVSFALDYIAKERKLRALAYHDALTGLVNRQLLHEHLKQALSLAHRLKRMIALVFIDLDHFKSVNNIWGTPRATNC
jgi:predicted signal transduction protein with EAL and GGDEF domain